jgi:hypothetical protein
MRNSLRVPVWRHVCRHAEQNAPHVRNLHQEQALEQQAQKANLQRELWLRRPLTPWIDKVAIEPTLVGSKAGHRPAKLRAGGAQKMGGGAAALL